MDADEWQRSVDVEQRSRADGHPVGGETVGAALGLLVAPAVAVAIGAVVFWMAEVVYTLARGGDTEPGRFVYAVDWTAQARIDWPRHALSLVVAVICAALLAWAGRWLGGRRPLQVVHRGRLVTAGSAAAASALVAAGGALLGIAVVAGVLRVRVIEGHPGPSYLGGVAVWIIAASLAGWHVARHRAGWPRIVLLAVTVAALAVTVAGARSAHAVGLSPGTAPAWFPLSLLSPDGWGPTGQALTPLTAVTSQLFDFSLLALVCSCFVIAYVARAAGSAVNPGPARAHPVGVRSGDIPT
jgi:hypothetical protein